MREADIEDRGVRTGGRILSNLRYADDTGLLADNIIDSWYYRTLVQHEKAATFLDILKSFFRPTLVRV